MSKRHRKARQIDRDASVELVDPRRVPNMLENLRTIVGARAELDAMQDHWVHCLMACGVSFTDIGAALGVSRQSAHTRYAGSVERLDATPEGSRVWITTSMREAVLGAPVNDP